MTDPISRAAVLEILRTPAASDTFPDMIRRVEALEGCGVQVKALEWFEAGGNFPTQRVWQFEALQWMWIVHNDGGDYVWCEDVSPSWAPASGVRGVFSTLEAAKAAAQADYEARILAALESVAQPETGEPIDIVTLCAAAPDLRSWTRHDVIVNPDGVLRALEQMAANLDRFRATREPGTEPTPGQFTTMCLMIEDVISGRGFDVDPWQPIETAQRPEGLPAFESVQCLVFCQSAGVQKGHIGWDMTGRVFAGSGGFHGFVWTHWMPLPKPPGETTSAIPEEVKQYMREVLMIAGWRGERD